MPVPPTRHDGTTGAADQLYGNEGVADLFDGYGGGDTVTDYGGGDVFVFNRGYGLLDIYEFDLGYGVVPPNVLQLGPGITPDQVTATQANADDILLTIAGADGDQVMLRYMLDSDSGGVQQVRFSNGVTWTRADILGRAAAMVATPGPDTIVGTAGADILDGRGGGDVIDGRGGGDTFIFNQGYGRLEVQEYGYQPGGGSPANTLQLGSGIDPDGIKVSGDAAGNVTLVIGAAGSGDVVVLDGELLGSAYGLQAVAFAGGGPTWSKADLLARAATGTAGVDDRLYGSAGGGETFDGKGGQDYAHGGGGGDAFVFGAGYGRLEIDEFDAALGAAANSLLLGPGIRPDQVRLVQPSFRDLGLRIGTDEVLLDNQGYDGWGVQSVRFAVDGTVWTAAQLLAKSLVGTAGVDDDLYGRRGADVLDGRGGNDVLHGGGGGDTFVFEAGYGKLRIEELDAASAQGNVLRLGASILASQVKVKPTEDGAGVVLSFTGRAGDQVVISSQLLGAGNGVQRVSFADGTSWSAADLATKAAHPAAVEIKATGGNARVDVGGDDAVVTLSGLNNRVTGGNGKVQVSGSQGNGAVILGDGDDTVLMEGWNNLIQLGNGHDTVVAGQGNATVRLGTGGGSVLLGGYNNQVTSAGGTLLVSGSQGNTTVSAGSGDHDITLGGYSNKVTTSGSGTDAIDAGYGAQIQVGAGSKAITVHGYGNKVTVGAGGTASIRGGDGNDQITLTDGVGSSIELHGWNNRVSTGSADRVRITDGAGGTAFRLGPHGNEFLYGFAYNGGSRVELSGGAGGYRTAVDAFRAVHDDAQHNAVLSFGAGGSVTFLGVQSTQLHASNFAIVG